MVRKKPQLQNLPGFSKRQNVAIRLLARGGARYGTMLDEMKQLKTMGYAVAAQNRAQRWVWHPTDTLCRLIATAGVRQSDKG